VQTTTFDTNPHKCLARLQVGQPSGGVEVVPLQDNTAIGTLMIGGTTLVTGSTIGAGNCTYTLADGTKTGLRKKFGIITAEVTTSDLVITVTTGVICDVGSTTLATATFTDAGTSLGTMVELVWGGSWSIGSITPSIPVIA
jgi:hypothetical protein